MIKLILKLFKPSVYSVVAYDDHLDTMKVCKIFYSLNDAQKSYSELGKIYGNRNVALFSRAILG